MLKDCSKIDQEILEAIQSYEGVPTACNLSKRRGGPLKYTDEIIGKRLKKNPELRQALELRGIRFIETCDRKAFDEYFTTLQLTSATGKTRKAIDKRLDTYILEAIESYEGIPNAPNLSKANGGSLEYSPTLIENRLKRNSELRQTLESRGIRFIETCDRNTFDECVTSSQWAQAIGKIRKTIDKRFDASILEAINSYEGIPTAFNLSKANGGPLEHSYTIIKERLKKNIDLQQALEIRGIQFVETCDRKKFDECFTTKQWTNATGKTRKAIENRVDAYILEGIQLYQGIPTAFTLSKANGGSLEYSHSFIGERLKKNPDLRQALEARGVQFIETCNRKTFDECFTTGQWKKATGKVREAIDKRLDASILEAINSYEGIPTAFTLSKANGGSLEYSHSFIGERLKKNPDLRQALEARGVQFIETCNRKTFDECFTTGQWKNATGKVREALDKRLDASILEAINSYEGIPTAFNLSKANGGPLEHSYTIIKERLKKNIDLQQALEIRGIRFVEICDRNTFDECITTCQWVQVPAKVRESIDKRLDAYMLEAIQSHPDILNAYNLSKVKGGPLEYSHSLIGERLKKNPELRRAIYLKRGLTEDRINALEIEQDNPSTALIESVRRRLPNTRVFREALGILRQFREIFEARRVHEISFYPEPFLRASEMIGLQFKNSYEKAHRIKRSDFKSELEGPFDSIAMLQFCHRLNQEALINMFNEINRILVEGGVALVSLPVEFSRTAAFENQVQDFGFELQTEGTLYTRTLNLEELASLGIEDPERLKQKIEQATNLFILVKTRPAIGKTLDEFVAPKLTNGNGEFIPSMEEIDTPEKLLLELSAVFQKKTSGIAEEAFILSVLHDTTYEEKHLVGHDMDPKRPRTVEVWSAKDGILLDEEIGRLSRKITDSFFQERILIRPGRETRIPARLVKNALQR